MSTLDEPAWQSLTPGSRYPTLIEIRPHCNLDRRRAVQLVILTAFVSFGAAGFVAALGAWPVFIFAALEMVAIIVALQRSMRQGRDWQRFRIDASRITIFRCKRGKIDTLILPRYWARVTLHIPASVLQPRRLCLESGGRHVEVGEFLNEEERERLRRTLAGLVGNMARLPGAGISPRSSIRGI